MATLDWHVTSERGVTLVSLLVESEATERVRVANCLDGPVWPPRRQGVPEEGWDEDGFEGVVAADERLVLGYASPADPTEPPARLASVGPDDGAGPVTPREVVRALGDPTPPRDAVSPGEGTTGTSIRHGTGPADGSNDERLPSSGATDGSRTERESDGEGRTGKLDEWEWGATTGEQPGDVPEEGTNHTRTGGTDAVEAYLDDVADRIEEAEQLAGVSSVPGATEAVASVGGPADIARLGERLDEDRERLERLAEHCEALARRAEAVEVPVQTLQRLA